MHRALFVFLLFSAQFVPAQISIPGTGGPGQYPGQTRYPGQGRGRGQGGPLGIPGTGGNSRRGRDSAPVTITTTGLLRVATGEQLILEADDHRVILYDLNGKTTFTKDGKPVEVKTFAIADHLTVNATRDDKGYFTAISITFNMPGSSEERRAAPRTWDLPALKAANANPASTSSSSPAANDEDRPRIRRTGSEAKSPTGAASNGPSAGPAPAEAEPERQVTTILLPKEADLDADDPGRPQLRRGQPGTRRSSSTNADGAPAAPATTPSVATLPPPPSAPPAQGATSSSPAASATAKSAEAPAPVIAILEDPVIEKAREAAAGYTASLPNFLVRQATTRYDSSNPKTGWNALDTTTADVTYEDGTQTYKNVKVGNKSVKSIEETGGTWSTGEFAGWMEDVLNPSSGARFRQANPETIAKRSAAVFKFEVPRERSNWRINAPAQVYYPAYRGTLWIDRATSRVLRIEVEARSVPLLFPFDKIETAIDYDFIRLAPTQTFLLPTTAEVLSCQSGSSYCLRNRIEFRNYKKFGAESGISFDEPDADPVK